MNKLKNNINNGIKYTGYVRIKIMQDDYVIWDSEGHNSGYKNLFIELAKSMAGDSFEKPGKILLCHNDSFTEDDPIQGATAMSQLVGSYAPATYNNNSVIFHFMVPYQNLKHVGQDINQLLLYSGNAPVSNIIDDTGLLAYFNLTSDNVIKVTGGTDNTNIIIDWQMSFGN